jgi:gamma-glutamylcyclotransferase (GGCT)/AIG2-like uncharacterized protein YtfP
MKIVILIFVFINFSIQNNNLFVYGTLMSKRILTSLIKRIPNNEVGFLLKYHNYQLSTVNYPGAKTNLSSNIKGINLLNLTEEELLILDRYEGREYKKKNSNIYNINNQTRISLFYEYIGNKRNYGEWIFENYFPESDRINKTNSSFKMI